MAASAPIVLVYLAVCLANAFQVPLEAATDVATFDEAGYRKVSESGSDTKMEDYIRSYVRSQGGNITSESELHGLSPWYSGTRATQSFANLTRELSTKTWIQQPPRHGAALLQNSHRMISNDTALVVNQTGFHQALDQPSEHSTVPNTTQVAHAGAFENATAVHVLQDREINATAPQNNWAMEVLRLKRQAAAGAGKAARLSAGRTGRALAAVPALKQMTDKDLATVFEALRGKSVVLDFGTGMLKQVKVLRVQSAINFVKIMQRYDQMSLDFLRKLAATRGVECDACDKQDLFFTHLVPMILREVEGKSTPTKSEGAKAEFLQSYVHNTSNRLPDGTNMSGGSGPDLLNATNGSEDKTQLSRAGVHDGQNATNDDTSDRAPEVSMLSKVAQTVASTVEEVAETAEKEMNQAETKASGLFSKVAHYFWGSENASSEKRSAEEGNNHSVNATLLAVGRETLDGHPKKPVTKAEGRKSNSTGTWSNQVVALNKSNATRASDKDVAVRNTTKPSATVAEDKAVAKMKQKVNATAAKTEAAPHKRPGVNTTVDGSIVSSAGKLHENSTTAKSKGAVQSNGTARAEKATLRKENKTHATLDKDRAAPTKKEAVNRTADGGKVASKKIQAPNTSAAKGKIQGPNTTAANGKAAAAAQQDPSLVGFMDAFQETQKGIMSIANKMRNAFSFGKRKHRKATNTSERKHHGKTNTSERKHHEETNTSERKHPSATNTIDRQHLKATNTNNVLKVVTADATAARTATASNASAATPCRDRVKRTFKPGTTIGLARDQSGKVLRVASASQAHKLGIQAGWVIRLANGQPLRKGILDELIHGRKQYVLTFEVPCKGAPTYAREQKPAKISSSVHVISNASAIGKHVSASKQRIEKDLARSNRAPSAGNRTQPSLAAAPAALKDLANATKENTTLVKVLFQPGPLGIGADWKAGRVEVVLDGSQAFEQGVQSGMIVRSVDGHPYSEAALDAKRTGNTPYELVFEEFSNESLSEEVPRDQSAAAILRTNQTSKSEQEAEKEEDEEASEEGEEDDTEDSDEEENEEDDVDSEELSENEGETDDVDEEEPSMEEATENRDAEGKRIVTKKGRKSARSRRGKAHSHKKHRPQATHKEHKSAKPVQSHAMQTDVASKDTKRQDKLQTQVSQMDRPHDHAQHEEEKHTHAKHNDELPDQEEREDEPHTQAKPMDELSVAENHEDEPNTQAKQLDELTVTEKHEDEPHTQAKQMDEMDEVSVTDKHEDELHLKVGRISQGLPHSQAKDEAEDELQDQAKDALLPADSSITSKPSQLITKLSQQIGELREALDAASSQSHQMAATKRKELENSLESQRENTSSIERANARLEKEIQSLERDNMQLRSRADELTSNTSALRAELQTLLENMAAAQEFIGMSTQFADDHKQEDKLQVLRELDEQEAQRRIQQEHESKLKQVGSAADDMALLQIANLPQSTLEYVKELTSKFEALDREENASMDLLTRKFEDHLAKEREHQAELLEKQGELETRKQSHIALRERLRGAVRHLEKIQEYLDDRIASVKGYVTRIGSTAIRRH